MELGAREPRTVALSADTQDLLGIRTYIERYPERFLELGIAEQNAIGVASGLATTGLRPYVCAYAPFITARSMEQVIAMLGEPYRDYLFADRGDLLPIDRRN